MAFSEPSASPARHRRATVGASICIPLDAAEPAVLDVLRRRLTFPNPAYLTAIRLGRKAWGIPHDFRCYDDDLDSVLVPRGAARMVRELVPGIRFDDLRSPCARAFDPVDVPLRDYQLEAVEAFLKVRQGYVVVPCGGGKTRIALGAAGRLGLRTLVLVHTHDLKAQWEANAASLGVPVEVMLVQEPRQLPPHDFLILDEAHHVAASTFHERVDASDARYRLGLTATPEREDGLTQLLDCYFGDKVFEITHARLVAAGHLVVPEVRIVETDFQYPYFDASDYGKMVAALADDLERRALVVSTVLENVGPGDVGLVLANRIGLCEEIASTLTDMGLPSFPLTSAQSKKVRQERLESAARGEVRCLCATSLADEGLDLPVLSKVFLAFPSRAMARTTQRLGRLMRPCPGKGTPVLFDFVDSACPVLKAQSYRRKALYRRVLGSLGGYP